jgi:hypothetical protein
VKDIFHVNMLVTGGIQVMIKLVTGGIQVMIKLVTGGIKVMIKLVTGGSFFLLLGTCWTQMWCP